MPVYLLVREGKLEGRDKDRKDNLYTWEAVSELLER